MFTRRGHRVGDVALLPDPFASVRRRMNALFDEFFGGWGSEATTAPAEVAGAPACAWEDDQHVFVEFDLPGVRKDDLDLKLENGLLHIRAERKMPYPQEGNWYDERCYGRLERHLRLPAMVDANSIDAQLHDGVLSIRLNKLPEHQPRHIEVKVE